MARALDRRSEELFILRADRNLPESEQTAFRVGPVSYSLRQRLTALVMAGEAMTAAWVNLALKECLLGVDPNRPLRDADGNEIPFKKSGKKGRAQVADSWLENLSQSDLTEIARDRIATFQPDLFEEDEDEDTTDDDPTEEDAERELSDMEK